MKKNNIFKRFLFILLFIVFLPLMLIYFIFKGLAYLFKLNSWKKSGNMGKDLLVNSNITQVDIMPGYEFEEYLRALFFYAGYSAEITQKSKDFGADLVLEKGDQRIIVQAKRYTGNVGVKCVQEIYSAKEHYQATDCSVVTNSHFSPQAEQLAKELGVTLIDREELIEMAKAVIATLSKNDEESFEETADFYNNPNKCAI